MKKGERKKERKGARRPDDHERTYNKGSNISDEKEKAGRDHLVFDVDAVFASSPCIPSSPPLLLTCVVWSTTA